MSNDDLSSIIAKLVGENLVVLPSYYLEESPVYPEPSRKLFDLLALNCLAANLSQWFEVEYTLTEDVIDLIKSMFKHSIADGIIDTKLQPITDLSAPDFTDQLLFGELPRSGVYSFLNKITQLEDNFLNVRALSYALPIFTLVSTPIVPTTAVRSNMLKMMEFGFWSSPFANSNTDIHEKLSRMELIYLKKIINHCLRDVKYTEEQWIWLVMHTMKRQILIYLSALLCRSCMYPDLAPIAESIRVSLQADLREEVIKLSPKTLNLNQMVV